MTLQSVEFFLSNFEMGPYHYNGCSDYWWGHIFWFALVITTMFWSIHSTVVFKCTADIKIGSAILLRFFIPLWAAWNTYLIRFIVFILTIMHNVSSEN